ncbi:MAG: hypothetical protein J6P36_02415, partial [Lachnospiraceae bacterium]|nr:hypothetical protein [Lachnospiraceae bacterium]
RGGIFHEEKMIDSAYRAHRLQTQEKTVQFCIIVYKKQLHLKKDCYIICPCGSFSAQTDCFGEVFLHTILIDIF